jgi:hypothetical protein
MANFDLKLPGEIWAIVFKDLCDQDLISCSRTCWAWNASANRQLYKTVTVSREARLQQLIETIADFQDYNEICVEGTIKRRQQLGELVQAVDIRVYVLLNDDIHSHFTRLSRLASGTPNVHTSKLSQPMCFMKINNNPSSPWGILVSQWPKLTSFTLGELQDYCPEEENAVHNINAVFDRIQHVDISSCEIKLTYMLPSPPNMPHLEAFMIELSERDDYYALRTILHMCQSTLHTLIIEFSVICHELMCIVDFDKLIMDQKQLKAFGLTTENGSPIRITSFGENLEHLAWQCPRTVEAIISNQSIYEVMIKTKNLKSLSLDGVMSDDHVALTLKSNKSTLHTFFYKSVNASGLISVLLMNKVQLDNVTTLCFDCDDFGNSDVRSFAQIFPNVEFLAVCRERPAHFKPGPWVLESIETPYREPDVEKDVKWIETAALSHFRHLKAIDRFTFLELLDPSSVTFQWCNILPYNSWETPRAVPMPCRKG